jgi:NADPH:quinone reductase-like Zn-dependent oxidoreductase
MKAAVRDRFGPPEVVELREIDKPVPEDGEVLVRVRAASVNIADWYAVVGRPYVGRPQMGLQKPKDDRLGVDYAGTVEAVGKDVTEFRPGDEVFGGRNGAYAEYIRARSDRGIVPKPANVTFEEAAAVPIAALTAPQGVYGTRDSFSRGRRSSSTARREAWARSPCRSPRRSEGR